ncbi:MAG: GxxExxY protein [Mariprofundaceae bacterium]|nr:GxxExxY protein [Mariprofundaceae bacterium]
MNREVRKVSQSIHALNHARIDAAMKVHTALGPGLLESAYEHCLCYELTRQGVHAAHQVALPIWYDGHKIDAGYRIDMLVENKIIIELKAVDKLLPVHEAQLLSYLRLANKRLGFLLNFNVKSFRDGIKRMVNNF